MDNEMSFTPVKLSLSGKLNFSRGRGALNGGDSIGGKETLERFAESRVFVFWGGLTAGRVPARPQSGYPRLAHFLLSCLRAGGSPDTMPEKSKQK